MGKFDNLSIKLPDYKMNFHPYHFAENFNKFQKLKFQLLNFKDNFKSRLDLDDALIYLQILLNSLTTLRGESFMQDLTSVNSTKRFSGVDLFELKNSLIETVYFILEQEELRDWGQSSIFSFTEIPESLIDRIYDLIVLTENIPVQSEGELLIAKLDNLLFQEIVEVDTQFTVLEENIANINLSSKEEINEVFNKFVISITKPFGDLFSGVEGSSSGNQEFDQILNKLVSEGHSLADLSNHFLQAFGERYINKLESVLLHSLDMLNLDSLELENWIGPQGVGKDTMQGSLKSAAKQFQSKEISDVSLSKLIDNLANENADVIVTGTGGIFNPGKRQQANIRYVEYLNLGKSVSNIINEGRLVNDEITSFFLLLEIIRSVLSGKNRLQLNVFPRSMGQKEYIALLASKVAEQGKALNLSVLHVEAVDRETAIYMERNNEETKVAYELIGKMERMIEINPTKFILENNDQDGFENSLALEDPDIEWSVENSYKNAIESEELELVELAKNRGAEMIEEFGEKLRIVGPVYLNKSLKEISDKFDSYKLDNIKHIFSMLLKARVRGFSRIAGRFRVEGRFDEASIKSIAKRIRSYDLDSAKAARNMDARIVPAAGRPDEAISDMLEALILQITPTFDLGSVEYLEFLDLVKEVNIAAVSRKEQ